MSAQGVVAPPACFHSYVLSSTSTWVSPISTSSFQRAPSPPSPCCTHLPSWPPLPHLDASYYYYSPAWIVRPIFNYPTNLLVFMEHKLRKHNVLNFHYQIVSSAPFFFCFEWIASIDTTASLEKRIKITLLWSKLSKFLNSLLNQVWKGFFEDAAVEYLDPNEFQWLWSEETVWKLVLFFTVNLQ